VRERRLIVSVSPEQLSGAAIVVERALAGTRYLAGAIDVLRSVVVSPGADARALVALNRERPTAAIVGVIVFGFFGGASGAGRLQFVAVERDARRAGIGATLVRAALAAMRVDGARFVLAELPDDTRELPGAREFLESFGFREESRVDDFFRAEIALAFMRLELDHTP
jgi:ribosomal protein S18 acetylase RimI-like enzyme